MESSVLKRMAQNDHVYVSTVPPDIHAVRGLTILTLLRTPLAGNARFMEQVWQYTEEVMLKIRCQT